MPKNEDIQHSLLIVSGNEQFDAFVKKTLHERNLSLKDFRRNASAARRCVNERFYDIVIINSPLPDESGIEFALDTAESGNISVLMVAPSEAFEDISDRVTEHGILVIPKPVTQRRMSKAVRFLASIRSKMRRLENAAASAHEKMEELRTVSKAKLLLIEKEHMSEDEAHRFIGKEAMDNGVSRKRIAEIILEGEMFVTVQSSSITRLETDSSAGLTDECL